LPTYFTHGTARAAGAGLAPAPRTPCMTVFDCIASTPPTHANAAAPPNGPALCDGAARPAAVMGRVRGEPVADGERAGRSGGEARDEWRERGMHGRLSYMANAAAPPNGPVLHAGAARPAAVMGRVRGEPVAKGKRAGRSGGEARDELSSPHGVLTK
jgi:hypothetical protein